MKPILTIFTPAYNRAHTIGRTYESLKKQNCKEFIWLIIDDGSTDNTSELVEQWKNESCGFEIRYIYKENGGMHTAHNIAYENIDKCVVYIIEFAVKKTRERGEEPHFNSILTLEKLKRKIKSKIFI